jgi:hypothetical protein
MIPPRNARGLRFSSPAYLVENFQNFHHFLRPPSINLFLTHNRFEAVLEKLAMSGVPSIESDDIAGQQPAHEIGQRDITGSEKKVGVVG